MTAQTRWKKLSSLATINLNQTLAAVGPELVPIDKLKLKIVLIFSLPSRLQTARARIFEHFRRGPITFIRIVKPNKNYRKIIRQFQTD